MAQLTDQYGYTAPVDSDPLDADELARYLDTIRTTLRAGSATEAAQKVQSVTLPALVLRTDTRTLWLYSTQRPAGEQIAGRGHGAHWECSTVTGPGVPGVVFAITPTRFVKASDGFAMASDFQVRIPADGMYTFSLSNHMDGATYNGRSFVELIVNGGQGFRFPGAGDNGWTGTMTWPCSAGDLIKVQGYHEAPDGTRRHFTCQVVCAQINDPAWVTL